MEVKHEDENILEDLKSILEKNHRVFQDIPKGLPPFREHGHQIELIPQSTPNKIPYRYLHQHKREIEKMLQGILDVGNIKPRRSSFSTSVVMVI